MQRAMIAVLVVSAVVLFVVVRGGRSGDTILPEGSNPSEGEAEAPGLRGAAHSSERQAVGKGLVAEGESLGVAGKEPLLGLVRRVASGWKASSTEQGGEAMQLSEIGSDAFKIILRDPPKAYRIVELVGTRQLDAEITNYWRALAPRDMAFGRVEAEVWWGTVLTLGFGAYYYTVPEFLVKEGIEVDGLDFLRRVLLALPHMKASPETVDDPQDKLIALLTRLLRDDGLMIDESLFSMILSLREADPEHADLYLGLLTRMGLDMDVATALETYGQLLSNPDDEEGYATAFRELIRHPELQGALLVDAGEMFDRLSPALKNALSMDIASNVGVEEAARFFAEGNVGDFMSPALGELSLRPGGVEAIAAEVNGLLERDERPDLRRTLIGGLKNAPAETLLYASLDPDASVRASALLAMSAWEGAEPSEDQQDQALDLLEQGAASQDSFTSLPSTESILSASNLLVLSKSDRVKDRAQEFLLRAARDESLTREDREAAIARIDQNTTLPDSVIASLQDAIEK